MLYRFIIVSDEIDDFRRDISIDSDATFFDLHEAILDSVGYIKDQVTSFFICGDDWTKETEITLIDMGSNSDEDMYVMNNCHLSELLDEERQKLVYVFEPLTERCFFMELREIVPFKKQDKPQIVKSVGNPPIQITQLGETNFMESTTVAAYSDVDDGDFYTNEFKAEDYSDEDIDNLRKDNLIDY